MWNYTALFTGSFLLDNGEVWSWDKTAGWERQSHFDPPVPVSDIKFWTDYTLVSSSTVENLQDNYALECLGNISISGKDSTVEAVFARTGHRPEPHQ